MGGYENKEISSRRKKPKYRGDIMKYKFIGCVPVNLGNWKTIDPTTGWDRGDGWREIYFHEATFDWSWLPPNSYGRFIMEMKNMDRESGYANKVIEFQLAWCKTPGEIKANKDEHFIHLDGAYFKEDKFKSWELYETDYFPLPTHHGPILLYLMTRGEEETRPSVAMWTLALFEKIEE